MRKITLSLVVSVLVTLSSFTAKAVTQSVGYKLWDSNNSLTATLVPGNLGSTITVYSISGHIAATVSAKSDTETITVPSAGIYIVRVNDKATKVLVK